MKQVFRHGATVLAVLAAGVLAGCAGNQPREYGNAPHYRGQAAQVQHYQSDPRGTRYGTVVGIESERVDRGTSGAGAVAGAVVGGVLGNQVGGGSGRALATIAGVIGGAVAGNAIEGQANRGSSGRYYVTVRFDDGSQQVIEVPGVGDLRRGDRVRYYQGQISRL